MGANAMTVALMELLAVLAAGCSEVPVSRAALRLRDSIRNGGWPDTPDAAIDAVALRLVSERRARDRHNRNLAAALLSGPDSAPPSIGDEGEAP